MSGSCKDLREYMNDPKVADAFSFIISGRKGYKAVIERRVEPTVCTGCKITLKEESKFCPECGTKVARAAPAPVSK